MSHELAEFDYALSAEEQVVCIRSMQDFANYMFGPAETSDSPFSKTEIVSSIGKYMCLTRYLSTDSNRNLNEVISCTLMIKPQNAEITEDEPEDSSQASALYNGLVVVLNTDVSLQSIQASHGFGRLAVLASGDIELEVTNLDNSRSADPLGCTASPLFSDQMALLCAYYERQ